MLENTLVEIGLSEKEASVYITCLKFPDQPTSIIARRTSLNRGTTFVILEQLLKKGLVTKSLSSEVARFTAVPPEDLITYLEQKEFTLKKHKEKISHILPEFRNIQGAHSDKPIFQFYDGKSGIRNMFTEMLRGEHGVIKGIFSMDLIDLAMGKDTYLEIDERRIYKKYALKLLVPYDDYQHAEFRTMPKSLRTTRYLPEPLKFPMGLFLFGDSVLLLSQKDKFGLSILSSEYFHMQESFFDTLWAISKDHISEDDFRMPIV